MKRRDFLFAGLSVSASALTLSAHALPTAASGTEIPSDLKVTKPNILGPYFRDGAPYRAKVSPPMAKGTVLLISGRVWSMKTKKLLAGATIDIWNADDDGHYDNDGTTELNKTEYLFRSRMMSREDGFYQYETVKPGRYKLGANTWRPSHIHYMVSAPGHKKLITQLYFEGDPYNKTDRFIHPSLIIPLKDEKGQTGVYKSGIFDIVLS